MSLSRITEERSEAWGKVFRYVTEKYPEIYMQIIMEEGLTPEDAVCRVYEVLESGFRNQSNQQL